MTWTHPRRTSLEVQCLIRGSELVEPPLGRRNALGKRSHPPAPGQRDGQTASIPGSRPPRCWLDFFVTK